MWGIFADFCGDSLAIWGDFVDFCGFGVDLEAILGRIPQFLAHFPHPSKPPR